MMHTEYMAPAASLRSLIRCYSYQRTGTGQDCWMRPLMATPEIRLTFFLSHPPVLVTGNYPGFIRLPASWIISGAFTHFAGQIIWPEQSKSFTIHFFANGFFRLFQLPGSSLTNRIIGKASWKGPCLQSLRRQIVGVENGVEASGAADIFLQSLMQRQGAHNAPDHVSALCREVNASSSQVQIGKLAKDAFVSLRQAERCFAQQIGIRPKLYCRLVRFEKALRLKQKNGHLCWTEIAHRCGYYDQMHLIKEFRQFAGEKPSGIALADIGLQDIL